MLHVELVGHASGNKRVFSLPRYYFNNIPITLLDEESLCCEKSCHLRRQGSQHTQFAWNQRFLCRV
jgi:hypothetical protein